MEIHKVIYLHLIEAKIRGLIHYDNCVKTAIEHSNLIYAILDKKNRLSVSLIQGKCSNRLMKQIARPRLNIGEKFNDRN